ncbi:MAG: mechanosensitive ion channel domain-containing protein [Bacteroidia bacterium]
MEFINEYFYGNQVKDYLIFAGILFTGFLLRRFFSKTFSKLLYSIFKKKFVSVGIKKFTELLQRPFSFFIITLTLFFAFHQLEFPNEWNIAHDDNSGIRLALWRIFQTALVFSITWVAVRAIEYFGLVLAVRASLTESKTDNMLVPFIKESLKIIAIILAVFFLLGSIYDLNIAALLGGAGIAGLAIALAAQETLGNLLGSFTIFLDKPFVVGDMIKVGNTQGRIEHIGFRSTRIRTLERSYVTIPNKKMIDAELDNLTERLLYRSRMLVDFRYNSKASDLRNFMEDLKVFLKDKSEIDDGYAVRLHEMTPNALQVVVLFFVKTNEWDEHIVTKEEVIFKIMELAEKNNLSFAFPSTSVYVEK